MIAVMFGLWMAMTPAAIAADPPGLAPSAPGAVLAPPPVTPIVPVVPPGARPRPSSMPTAAPAVDVSRPLVGLPGTLVEPPEPPVADLGASVDSAVRAATGPEVATSVRLIVVLTMLSVLPGLILLSTPFARFLIVLSMLRQALGMQQSPPNQVLVGLALILTTVVMRPTLEQMNERAVQPYLAGEMDTSTAVREGIVPMRAYMLEHMTRDDLGSAIRMARLERPSTVDDLPTPVVVVGFVLSELREAFVTSVKVYVPFLVIDLVVASVLLGLGMMMVPPVAISLPFKLLVFVLMDGWTLLLLGLARGAG